MASTEDTAKAKTETVKKSPEPDPAPAPAPVDNTFPIERILSPDECFALTGIERHLVVGALYNTTKTNLTIDEVRQAVENWLSAPVKED